MAVVLKNVAVGFGLYLVLNWKNRWLYKVSEMAKAKKKLEIVVNNFVAKHMHEVNQSQVFVDRKKNAKRGYDKHKKGRYSDDYLPFLMPLLWV